MDSSLLTTSRQAIIMMGISSYMFSFMHAGTKVLNLSQIPISQMIATRCISLSFLLIIVTQFYQLPYGSLGPKELRPLLLTRAIFSYLGLLSFMASVTYLSLGDAVTLSFLTPTLMVIASIIWFEEPLSTMNSLSILLGLIGIICIAQPKLFFLNLVQNKFQIMGYIYAISSAIFNAGGNLLIRKIGNRVHTLHIVTYAMIIPIIPSLLWCILIDYHHIVWPSSFYYWFWFIMMILGALLGQLLFSRSLQIAPVTVVTPLISLQVIFAFLNDWILFQLTPPLSSLIGALFISISIIITL